MATFLSDRLPLPSLKSYTVISTSLYGASLVYGKSVSRDYPEGTTFFDVVLTENFCLWASVNMAYCLLFLVGKVIQKVVLGDLRSVEEQHLQDKFWNYVFYKVIFIFGVMNAQTLTEVLCWAAWFSMLGFWHMFGQLCKDRYEYLTASPNTEVKKHVKLLCLLCSILASSLALGICAVFYGYPLGMNIFCFMMAECLLLGLKALHVLVRYCIQLCDISQAALWDGKTAFVYYADFLIDSVVLSVNLVYHIHMLIWSNVFLSMASLVLYWNIRTILSEIKLRMKKHRVYRAVQKNVQEQFPLASASELEDFGDNCAICWDDMMSARKLPCGHLFHHGCVCSWLQQDASCPTCRRPLSRDLGLSDRPVTGRVVNNEDGPRQLVEVQEIENEGFRNYFFHLDGQRIANWFPSFSVEVFHGRVGNVNDQDLDALALEVSTMFPNVPREAIYEDLRLTGSAEVTAENILEGRLSTSITEEPEIEVPDERLPARSGPSLEEEPPETGPSANDPAALLGGPAAAGDESGLFEGGPPRQRPRDRARQEVVSESRRRLTSKPRDPSQSRRLPEGSFGAGTSTSDADVLRPVKNDLDERRSRLLAAAERRWNFPTPQAQPQHDDDPT